MPGVSISAVSFLQGVSTCVSTSVPLGVSSSGCGTVSSLALCQQELSEELVPPWLHRGRMHGGGLQASEPGRCGDPCSRLTGLRLPHSLWAGSEPRPGSRFRSQPALKEVKTGGVTTGALL